MLCCLYRIGSESERPVTRKLVPPTVGPGGPVMAIQDSRGPTMAATNGPPGPVYGCHNWSAPAVVGPMALYTVAAITGPGDHLWQPMVGPGPSWIAIAGPGPRIAAANGPEPTKAAEIGPSCQVEMAE